MNLAETDITPHPIINDFRAYKNGEISLSSGKNVRINLGQLRMKTSN